MIDKKPMGRDDGHQMDYSRIYDGLFLGSDLCTPFSCKLHSHEFKKIGITVEMSLTAEVRDGAHDDLDAFTWIPVVDGYAPTEYQLDLGSSFINESVENGKKIYIHCKNGHARSPTMIAAYLVRFKKMSVEDAEKLLMEKRPEIHIENVQKEALKKFEQKWLK